MAERDAKKVAEGLTEAQRTYDARGRQIAIGDVLKVYHFTGARRKRHYMYKQVTGIRRLGPNDTPYFTVSHLTMGKDPDYMLALDGKALPDHEIIQGIEAYWEEERPVRDHLRGEQ